MTSQTRTAQILKGCEKEVRVYDQYIKKYHKEFCGKNNYLCSECQARLSERKLALEEIKEILEKGIVLMDDIVGCDACISNGGYIERKIKQIEQELEEMEK